MKLGFTEFFVVLLIIGIIIAVSVFFPSGRKKQNQELIEREPRNAEEARDQKILRGRRSGFKISGVVMVILGIILIVSAPSLLRYFFMSYIGGGIIILLGLAAFFFSRRS
jgi:Na+/H+ antiporter NhaD/arsenite permease-like protein